MRAVQTRLTSVAGYLAFVAGLGILCAHLSHHLGTHAVSVASPYLTFAKAERKLTLVERRQVEATVVAESAPVANTADTADAFVLDAPSIPAGVLAAQMDISEGADFEEADLIKAKSTTRRVAKRSAARPARVAAADVFGRSFGVMLTASR